MVSSFSPPLWLAQLLRCRFCNLSCVGYFLVKSFIEGSNFDDFIFDNWFCVFSYFGRELRRYSDSICPSFAGEAVKSKSEFRYVNSSIISSNPTVLLASLMKLGYCPKLPSKLISAMVFLTSLFVICYLR